MTTYTRILATVLVVALVVIAGALVVGAKQSSNTAKQVVTLQKSVLKLQKSVDLIPDCPPGLSGGGLSSTPRASECSR